MEMIKMSKKDQTIPEYYGHKKTEQQLFNAIKKLTMKTINL